VTPEAVAIIERLFKAAIFVPTLALVAWWITSNWLVEQTLNSTEAAIGLGIVITAFGLGVISIVAGGWGFLGVIAVVYLLTVAVAAWEFVYWRRREKEHLLSEIEKYTEAIDLDPTNAAAYSFLGQVCLRLSRFEEAEAALTKAVELDPKSERDRRRLQQAQERRPYVGWRRLD
jgi:cytochrome c-type biogenesis protein CcmH/NrfG